MFLCNYAKNNYCTELNTLFVVAFLGQTSNNEPNLVNQHLGSPNHKAIYSQNLHP